jgi:hypothetical protein
MKMQIGEYTVELNCGCLVLLLLIGLFLAAHH